MIPTLEFDARLAPHLLQLTAALKRVEAVFDEQLASDLPPIMQLVSHVEKYRGKMLRPMLVLLCGQCVSGDDGLVPGARHLAAGAVCEMVHMATLVHDDVLDEADTRRRGDTVNRLHGNETAVILGDYLIASAYHLCSSKVGHEGSLAVARASTVMCSGELLQLHHRADFSLDEATYFEIIRRKTGELIATACELGAVLAGASDPGIYYNFGMELGVAFQIQDDLLDLTGSERVVGKSVGKDLEKGKLTLPIIHMLYSASRSQRGELLLLLEQACVDSGLGDRAAAAAMSTIAACLESSGSIRYARGVASSYVDRAKSRLGCLPGAQGAERGTSAAKEILLTMADAVVARAF